MNNQREALSSIENAYFVAPDEDSASSVSGRSSEGDVGGSGFTGGVEGREAEVLPRRVRSTQVKPSTKILRDILDFPTRRSRKMMGISTILNPFL